MKSKFVTQASSPSKTKENVTGVCERNPKSWGVVVGINDYLSPLITDLDGAAVDATVDIFMAGFPEVIAVKDSGSNFVTEYRQNFEGTL